MALTDHFAWQVRRALRPLYYRFDLIRRQRQLNRLWRQSRRPAPPSFFPAIASYELSTRAYAQSRPATNQKHAYIPIPDTNYFNPPPPKTVGENPLAHQIIPTNPPLFVAKLANPRIYGDAGDIITNDNVLLPDISFRHVVNLWQERGEHLPLEQQTLTQVRPLRGSCALLTSRYGGMNYFHWLYNVLPRVALLERAAIPRRDLTLLVNRLDLPAMRETLQVLDISPDQIVEMDEATALQPESVWVMPSFLRTGHRRRWFLDWLRSHFMRANPSHTPTLRLYLSRADTTSRRVVNEAEVMAVLAPLGFEKIIIGSSSIFEQSSLFARAETVLAPHGAGLANIVFSAPGTRVIEFMLANRLRTYMFELSAAMGLEYSYGLLRRNPPSNQSSMTAEETILPLDHLQSMLRYAKIS